MGIGIQLPGVTLSDGDDILVIKGTTLDHGIESGVTQRVFANGQQRAFTGYSSYDPIKIALTEVTAEDRNWLDIRIGKSVVYRTTIGEFFSVIIGNLKWKLVAALDDSISYSTMLTLFIQETN